MQSPHQTITVSREGPPDRPWHQLVSKLRICAALCFPSWWRAKSLNDRNANNDYFRKTKIFLNSWMPRPMIHAPTAKPNNALAASNSVSLCSGSGSG
jgi:hypothetical protein